MNDNVPTLSDSVSDSLKHFVAIENVEACSAGYKFLKKGQSPCVM